MNDIKALKLLQAGEPDALELWLEPENLSVVGFMYWHKKTRP